MKALEESLAKAREDQAFRERLAAGRERLRPVLDRLAASPTDPAEAQHALAAARMVLAEREAELLQLKGPCSNVRAVPCRLHYAHRGPCCD